MASYIRRAAEAGRGRGPGSPSARTVWTWSRGAPRAIPRRGVVGEGVRCPVLDVVFGAGRAAEADQLRLHSIGQLARSCKASQCEEGVVEQADPGAKAHDRYESGTRSASVVAANAHSESGAGLLIARDGRKLMQCGQSCPARSSEIDCEKPIFRMPGRVAGHDCRAHG